jgi:undecaprenyl diphosphate synthase
MTTEFIPQYLPRHIAIIMDGNGRWAQQTGRPRVWGHRQGAKTVRTITEECARLGLGQLTLYAFSLENWRRPEEEVNALMALLRRFLIKEREILMKNNIRLTAIGRLAGLPAAVRAELEFTRKMTAHNTGMILCLALSYGGRGEILDAVKAIAGKVAAGQLQLDMLDEKLFSQHLYQPDMPEPDLLIRTGGEMRISNFLLWQISYAELWVTPVMWPDFGIAELHQALHEFGKRERRFGKVPSTLAVASQVVS